MPTATTIFRPNARDTEIAYVPASGYRRATAGGCSLSNDGMAVTIKSNETSLPWNGDSTVAIVGAARDIDANIDYRARAMFRFVFRAQTIDVSSLVSGVVPATWWWPYVTAARLVWWNGDTGGLQGVSPRTIEQDSLKIRVGRGLYTATGANEKPFGGDTEAGTTYPLALTFGQAEATLAWADWGSPSRVWRTLSLSQSAIDTLLKTITGPTNDYIDFAFYLAQEGVEGIDILRELGAWEPKPPRFEIDFQLPGEQRLLFVAAPPTQFAIEGMSKLAHVAAMPSVFAIEGVPSRFDVSGVPGPLPVEVN